MISMMAIQAGRTHGIDVGALIDTCLRDCGMTHKEAWIACGYATGAEWSRALQGVDYRPIDLWKLAELPWKFQAMFWSRYIALQAVRLSADLRAERMAMARASITTRDNDRKVG